MEVTYESASLSSGLHGRNCCADHFFSSAVNRIRHCEVWVPRSNSHRARHGFPHGSRTESVRTVEYVSSLARATSPFADWFSRRDPAIDSHARRVLGGEDFRHSFASAARGSVFSKLQHPVRVFCGGAAMRRYRLLPDLEISDRIL